MGAYLQGRQSRLSTVVSYKRKKRDRGLTKKTPAPARQSIKQGRPRTKQMRFWRKGDQTKNNGRNEEEGSGGSRSRAKAKFCSSGLRGEWSGWLGQAPGGGKEETKSSESHLQRIFLGEEVPNLRDLSVQSCTERTQGVLSIGNTRTRVRGS